MTDKRPRKLNSISFYPLRDASGTIQLLMDASKNAELADALSQVPVESTVVVEGTVVTRPLSAQRPVRALPSLPSAHTLTMLTGSRR